MTLTLVALLDRARAARVADIRARRRVGGRVRRASGKHVAQLLRPVTPDARRGAETAAARPVFTASAASGRRARAARAGRRLWRARHRVTRA